MTKNCIVCGTDFPAVGGRTICSNPCRDQRKKDYAKEYYTRPGVREKWVEYNNKQKDKRKMKKKLLEAENRLLRKWCCDEAFPADLYPDREAAKRVFNQVLKEKLKLQDKPEASFKQSLKSKDGNKKM